MTVAPGEALKIRPAPWTPNEKKRLRFLWAHTIRTRAQIAQELGRTIDGCSAQARAMMLTRFRPDAAAIINQLASRKISEGSRVDAERQAKRIREYWLALGQPKTVDVRYVQGRGGYAGSWSPVILDEMVWCAPEVERMKR
jgi:hypothetical protein